MMLVVIIYIIYMVSLLLEKAIDDVSCDDVYHLYGPTFVEEGTR